MNTLAKSIIGGLIALISTMLGAYFIWLGTEINSIDRRVERLDVNVNTLLQDRSQGRAR